MAVPLTVVTGCLGAGKTSLINALLRRLDEEGPSAVRTGLLVNDFAEANIDAQLIRREGGRSDDDSLVELTNGCVCCSISGELENAVDVVLRRGDIEHVILETSGVSDPAALVETLALPRLRTRVWLSVVVVVIDAETCVEGMAHARGHLRHADVVVLNKADLLTDAEYRTAKAHVREALLALQPKQSKGVHDSQLPIIPSRYGVIPLSVVFAEPKVGDEGSHAPAAADPHALWRDIPLYGRKQGKQRQQQEDGHGHGHGLGTVTYAKPHGTLIDLARFQRFVAERFPPGALRAKGFLRFACTPDRAYALQMSGRRRFDATAGAGGAGSRAGGVSFVFIGADLDGEAIARDLDACCWDGGIGDADDVDVGEKEENASGEAWDAVKASLEGRIAGDPRFEIVAVGATDCASLVHFRLAPSRWHGMDADDVNRALLSTLNLGCARTGLFFTHHQAADGGPMAVRVDVRLLEDAEAAWRAIAEGAEDLLTKIFLTVYCCG